jgi:hypothetical protein
VVNDTFTVDVVVPSALTTNDISNDNADDISDVISTLAIKLGDVSNVQDTEDVASILDTNPISWFSIEVTEDVLVISLSNV